MLAWSPILIQKIEIHALGFVLRKLQLNRHRETEVSNHRHAFNQLILYLSGEGVQVLRDRRIDARAGDLFLIPPGVDHGFSLSGASRPLCLVLEYESRRPGSRVLHRHLPRQVLNELNALLARVPTKGRPALSDYPTILSVIALLLEPPRTDSLPTPSAASPLVVRVRESLRSDKPLTEIARESGYVRDALSRRLKREHGLGLRALRDQERLQIAQSALRESAGIGAAAGRAGFDDPNYFTRWFRKQTGLTPSAWRRQ
ncbi:AraC family transcriptional regulator [Verrucomicrobia bacterium IMCC26134]|jgi:AraC-like DNA-binding protein|nr:AraC family transcriptional regulator [Verrucomicrobia bacterium IMCC26134]